MNRLVVVTSLWACAAFAQARGKFVPLDAKDITQLATRGDAKAGAVAYEVCAGCHLPSGAGKIDGTFPQLAGQHSTVLLKQLTDMRAGVRAPHTMHPFSMALINSKLADLAAYIATLPVPRDNGIGPGNDLERGAKLYESDCKTCHGARGEGDAARIVPALAGQHYPYLLRQTTDIRDGRRKHSTDDMGRRLVRYDDKETVAVVDYLSRLNVPTPKN